MIVAARRLTLPLLATALVASVSSCASDSLRERDARSVRVGQVLAPSATAAVRGTQSQVMVPSGRIDLTLTKPVTEIPAQDTASAVPLRPADGAAAVGVAWSLNRGGYTDSTNRQLAEPKTIFGVPQPVRLWLVTDSTRREIPRVGTLQVPGARARNAAWLVVPAGVRSWSFEVSYDGVVQRVDARTGRVTPGVAAPLYQPLPLDYRASCEFASNSDNYTSCGIQYAAGFPYVDGAGWAPKGKTYAVLKVTAGSSDDGGRDLLVAGARSVAVLTEFSQRFRAFLVTPARSYPVSGNAPAERTDGKTEPKPVTGTLATDRTAP